MVGIKKFMFCNYSYMLIGYLEIVKLMSLHTKTIQFVIMGIRVSFRGRGEHLPPLGFGLPPLGILI